jgi:glycosyltransferase involved in cell wall biosynthesis
MSLRLSVILPTHNPDPNRLQRTLAGLRSQTLPANEWDIVLVDNASTPAVAVPGPAPANLRIVREPQLGLTAARQRGFRESIGAAIVMVDDDNVLAPDYLERAIELLATHPRIGTLGGRSAPEFAATPPAWIGEFLHLLACRDLGAVAKISSGLRPEGAARNEYPAFAPIGAGMVLRREAAHTWLDDADAGKFSDRRGNDLTSGGDNDIVLTSMRHGWETGYFPELSLTHLIPAGRTTPEYLARLHRGIAKSWVQVLARHHACPWPSVAGWTVPLRQFRAWFTYRAWAGPVEHVKWQGACGHFEGLATLR